MAHSDFWHNSSNRLTFAMSDVAADSYTRLCKEIAARFGLSPAGNRCDSFEVMFEDYHLGEQVIGLEWDNWSGFIVVAKNPQSEPLVQTIGAWLLSSAWARPSRPPVRPYSIVLAWSLICAGPPFVVLALLQSNPSARVSIMLVGLGLMGLGLIRLGIIIRFRHVRF